jgi:DNA-binding NarL/FixJ family response regulator
MKPLEMLMSATVSDRDPWRSVENEREVLRQLVATGRGALVLWDPNLRAAWMSPQAEAFVSTGEVNDELERTAVSVLRKIQPVDKVPLGCSELGCARMRSSNGAQLLAEFSSVRTPRAGLWLLAELKSTAERCPQFASLSIAERRVFGLLMDGLSNREIGRALFISQETVKTHVSRVLHKLGVSSRAKAARLGREAGFQLESQGASAPPFPRKKA